METDRPLHPLQLQMSQAISARRLEASKRKVFKSNSILSNLQAHGPLVLQKTQESSRDHPRWRRTLPHPQRCGRHIMIHGDSKIAPLWESHLYALVKDDTSGSPPPSKFSKMTHAHVPPQLDFEIGNSPFGNEIFIAATFHSNSKFFFKLFRFLSFPRCSTLTLGREE